MPRKRHRRVVSKTQFVRSRYYVEAVSNCDAELVNELAHRALVLHDLATCCQHHYIVGLDNLCRAAMNFAADVMERGRAAAHAAAMTAN